MPMKKKDIQVGKTYLAKVAGRVTTVRVDAITEIEGRKARSSVFGRSTPARTIYSVTNLATGRKTSFRSAGKFRAEVTEPAAKKEAPKPKRALSREELGLPMPSQPKQNGTIERQGIYFISPGILPSQGGVVTNCRFTNCTFSAECGKRQFVGCAFIDCKIDFDIGPACAGCTFTNCITPAIESEDEDEYCTDEEPDCCEGEPGETCPGCGKLVKEAEQRPDPTRTTETPSGDGMASGGLAERMRQANNERGRVGTTGDAPHVIVQARAGTGKTTTIIEGLKRMRGLPVKITPSPQQAAIWAEIDRSKGAKYVCFVAFGKAIAVELQQRMPPGCNAMTMHSMGYRAVQRALGRQEPKEYAVEDILLDMLGIGPRPTEPENPEERPAWRKDMDAWMKRRAEKTAVLSATEQLVSLCKLNLVHPEEPRIEKQGGRYVEAGRHRAMAIFYERLDELASYYDVELNGSREEVYGLVPRVLEECKHPKGVISFDDMIWLPVILNLPIFQYDLLLVDEAQDLNRCQQALAKRAGKRLILVGDERQAIFGFAGADRESMAHLGQELDGLFCPRCWGKAKGCETCGGSGKVGRRLITLPLTVTRRCGKAIVEEAKRIVPDFEAHESNGDGKVLFGRYEDNVADGTCQPRSYADQVREGDMVLCRVNAPLVSQCFRFLKRGRKATIQGKKDIGKGIAKMVDKFKAENIVDLVAKLSTWLHREQAKEKAKRHASELRLAALKDKHDCLLAFTEHAETVEQVKAKIDAIFTDNTKAPGILLSSIHKAKGLESRRVFLLRPKGAECPHPMAKAEWEQEQEMNLLYVAITRAIEEFIYVS